jgi:DNA-binding winged helix-turn-helix (wHTH) protein
VRRTFRGFELDFDGRRVFRGSVEVVLERRACELLFYLAEQPGRLVGKDELLANVWKAKALTDGALSNAVWKLRKALGQKTDAEGPIRTVHGVGYRWEPSPTEPGARAAIEADREDPFVGRVAALAALHDALHATQRGRGHAVLVIGEAGIGKSRLLERLARHARDQGFGVCVGAGYEGGGAPAYWPWTQVLRALHAELEACEWDRHVPAESWALPLLAPELCANARPCPEGDARALRFRLFDEIAQLFASLAAERRMLVVFEDLHFADAGSIELLTHVARALDSRSILFVATARTEEAGAFDSRLEAMGRLERVAKRIALTGLSASEVSLLTRELGVPGVEGRMADALYTRTSGNPFFVRQLALLALQDDTERQLSALTTGVPLAVRAVVRQRIAGSDASTLSALETASVIGQEFEATLLAEVLGIEPARALTLLEPVLRLRMVEALETPGRFGFSHALSREALYEDIGPARLGELHARVLRVLGEKSGYQSSERLGEIARHSLLSVPFDAERCVKHCRDAAAAARATCGFEAAADFLSRAVHKLECEGEAGTKQAELLLLEVMDRFCSGDVGAAWRTLRHAQHVARGAGRTDVLARLACLHGNWMELGGVEESEVRAAIDEALQRVGRTNGPLRAELLARQVWLEPELDSEERARILDEADGLSRGAGEAEIAVAFARASDEHPGRASEARAATALYRELVRQHRTGESDPTHALDCFRVDICEYVRALLEGDAETAERVSSRFQANARTSGTGSFLVLAELMRAGRQLASGRLDLLKETLSRLQGFSDHWGDLGRAWSVYAFHRDHATGDGASWRAAADSFDPTARLQNVFTGHRLFAMLWIAWVCTKIGRNEHARQFLRAVPRAHIEPMPARYGDLGTLCYLAEVYEALGDVEGASWLYPRLAPYASLNAVGPVFEHRGPVGQYLERLESMMSGARNGTRRGPRRREAIGPARQNTARHSSSRPSRSPAR